MTREWVFERPPWQLAFDAIPGIRFASRTTDAIPQSTEAQSPWMRSGIRRCSETSILRNATSIKFLLSWRCQPVVRCFRIDTFLLRRRVGPKPQCFKTPALPG
jgi:hypothetical protein